MKYKAYLWILIKLSTKCNILKTGSLKTDTEMGINLKYVELCSVRVWLQIIVFPLAKCSSSKRHNLVSKYSKN